MDLPVSLKPLLHWLLLLRYMAAPQAAMFFEKISAPVRTKLVRRKLRDLVARGILGCFDSPPSGKAGRPEKVYYIKKAALKRLLPWLGIEHCWEGYTLSAAPSGTFIHHHLEINDFLLKWKVATEVRRLSWDFIAEYHMVREVGEKTPQKCTKVECRHPHNPVKDLTIVPDWANTLENPKTCECALFLGELDRGTEPKRSRKAVEHRTDVRSKLLAYLELLDADGLDLFARRFGHEFNGFRVLVVSSRPEAINEVCREINTADTVWVAHRDEITPENIFGPIWTVPGIDETRPLLERRKHK